MDVIKKKFDFNFKGVTFKTQSYILHFHLFAYPLLSISLMLWVDFNKMIKYGFTGLLQDRVSLALSIGILCSVAISTSASVMLYKGLKKKSLLLLRIYTAVYFSSVIINSSLYAFKNYRDLDRLKELRSLFVIIASLAYILQYIIDGTTLLIAAEQFRNDQGFQIRTKLFGFSIEKLLYGDVAFTWVACVYMVILYYITFISEKNPKQFKRMVNEITYTYLGNILSFIANGINGFLLWVSIRKKSAKCLKYYAAIKIILTAIFGIFWMCTNRAVAKITGRPLDPPNKIMPIFATLLFITTLFLLDCYLKGLVNEVGFRQDQNASISENAVESRVWTLSRKLMKSENIPWVKVTLDKGGPLGSGYFAKVWKGTLEFDQTDNCSKTKVSVAVKILKNDNSPSENNLDDIISEVKFLNALENAHENLVKFYGVTSHMGGMGIVLEYCSSSTLQNYLRHRKNSMQFPHDVKEQDISKLRNWAMQVASALDFLARKNIIHGDVATRNVLLDEFQRAKVTDFGSSIHLYNYQFYAQSQQSVFPWRWMAPEVLADLKFSIASDVWSYGVLLWEIYSFGELPWQGLEWTSDFVSRLKSGICFLEKPTFASEQIYNDILCKCQRFEEVDRPQFWEILNIFNSFTRWDVLKQGSPERVVYLNEAVVKDKSIDFPQEITVAHVHYQNNYAS